MAVSKITDFEIGLRRAVMDRRILITGFAFLLGLGGLFAQEAGEPRTVIQEISGTVEVKAPDAADWTPAARGQVLERRTLISTGFKSSALIAIGNSTLSVQPLTRLSLEELVLSGNSEKVDLNLRAGRVRANVRPPAGGTTNFEVRSPTATASVRGTVFEFNGTELRVDEGRVHLSGGGGNGTYVGMGHLARTDTETGRTTGAAETARETLTPAMPAGVDQAAEIPAALPSTGDIDAGFDWR
jgi:hypothetical protein